MRHTKTGSGLDLADPRSSSAYHKTGHSDRSHLKNCDDRNQLLFASADKVGIYLKEPAGNFQGYGSVHV